MRADATEVKRKVDAQQIFFSVATVAGLFFLGRYVYRDVVAKQEQKKTFDDGSPQADAQLVKLAFENNNFLHAGTDNETLRQIFVSIPSKDHFRKMIDSYSKLYKGASMMADMKDELKTGEYLEMLAIISNKPEHGTKLQPLKQDEVQFNSWAARIYAAFKDTFLVIFDSVDKEAIREVFYELPSKQAYEKLKQAYSKYGDLEKELKDRLRFWEYDSLKAIIDVKP